MDSKQIALGILDGITSVGVGFYDGVIRTAQGSGLAGSRLKQRNAYETERFMRIIKSTANRQEPIRNLITIIVTDFYSKITPEGREAINSQIGYGVGRISARTGSQFVLAQFIAQSLLTRMVTAEAYKRFIRVGSSFTLNVLMLQGLVEEAAKASRRMQEHYPQTYMKVSRMNLDMVYFLVEKPLQPYLVYINSHPMFCKRVDNELCKSIVR
ncbi:hypothetical protein PMPD1_2036 [Paramixta manurensis]|uniref:Uncharacterized protein n=1 Tax=Paramixta manurensis TaxID=2740817 RepID=A0A6M8UBR2_9GAMM|nr:hypothetical protein PMPD1_2036 [Erwiniaceae bacterium PD-1]